MREEWIIYTILPLCFWLHSLQNAHGGVVSPATPDPGTEYKLLKGLPHYPQDQTHWEEPYSAVPANTLWELSK